MSLSPHPNGEHTGQDEFWQNRQILIVSAVKICKQCLQLLQLQGALPLDPTGGLASPDPLGYRPRNENSWHYTTADEMVLRTVSSFRLQHNLNYSVNK